MALVLLLGGPPTIVLYHARDFVAFISYLSLLTWPMMALGWSPARAKAGRRWTRRHDSAATPDIAMQPCLRGVVFEAVGFSYPGRPGAPLPVGALTCPSKRARCSASSGPGSGKPRCSAIPGCTTPRPAGCGEGRDVRGVRVGTGRSRRVMPRDSSLPAPSGTTSPSEIGLPRRLEEAPRPPCSIPCGPFPQALIRGRRTGRDASGGRSSAWPSPAACSQMHRC
jgi:hypothetical protein